ncbi:MAG: hypothetical protein KKA76_12320 [Proteobacteria bacterium]|nr:hypothetical protein [Pseudomonadota bacterium]
MTRKARHTSREQRRQFFTIFLCAAGLLFLLSSCADTGSSEKSAMSLSNDWGIEVTRLHLTANGYMVDFRYRVLDAKKAQDLFSRQNKPYLIDQASGKVVAVPNIGKVGPLRNSNMPKEGKIYWMFFDNISGLIKTGNKVTVVIGDFRAEDLVVI